ncbi:hypothetical protein [Herbiconiux solani]|uniref:hypothetical protein n=1 Tax=Herbiconiux solani TaxID=661329 RepID=UPI000824FBDE|nr:hypothetical protein [Herbiconiux solani]
MASAAGSGSEGGGTGPGPGATDAEVAAALAAILSGTVAALEASGARTEALASFEERRAILGVRRSPVMVARGRVWRLGVLLLDAAGGLHTIGRVTRAIEPGRVTNQSARAEERRDYRRAAFAGKFAEGDTVNFDTGEVDLAVPAIRAGTGVLSLAGDTVMVRWNLQPGAVGTTPLEPYLTERAALLTAPPP